MENTTNGLDYKLSSLDFLKYYGHIKGEKSGIRQYVSGKKF